MERNAVEKVVFEFLQNTEISGTVIVMAPESMEEELTLRIVQIKNSAQEYGGFVVDEDEQTTKLMLDGEEKTFHQFFFLFKFSDKELMKVWKSSDIM